jgi:hypothetical protein
MAYSRQLLHQVIQPVSAALAKANARYYDGTCFLTRCTSRQEMSRTALRSGSMRERLECMLPFDNLPRFRPLSSKLKV